MKKILLFISFILFFVGIGFSQKNLPKINKNVMNIRWSDSTYVIKCSNFHVTKPLRDIVAEHAIDEKNTYPYSEYQDKEDIIRQKFVYNVEKNGEKYGNDSSIIQSTMGKLESKSPIENWAGQTSSGIRPFDPTGAASANYYLQMINATSFRIYTKTGTVLYTGILGDLWTPATKNAGDPIVLYDKAADRWFLSQFSDKNNEIYIAISKTSDPTGSWYTYTFTSPEFPDYLKFSAWADGYYMTSNQDQKVFCFERSKMLAGDSSARAIYKSFSPPESGFFVPLSADASDGTMPAQGTPCPIFSYSDDAWGNGNIDAVNIYNMSVSWGENPSASIQLAGVLPTKAFDASYDSNWDDIAQPKTSQKLDGIGGVMMFRAQWKTWSGYNSVVLNWAVKMSKSRRSIFWCELRQNQSTDNWAIYQQGIYAPDSDSRWLGSIAMNDAGDIALAYAKGSDSTYMSLAYVGRRPYDPLGTLPIAEVVAQLGTGSQTITNRDGDYSHTCLDPDGLTFWHTGEYMKADGSAGTRVFSFRLPETCTTPTVSSINATYLYKDRGKQLTVTGHNLKACFFRIGGIIGTIVSNVDSIAVINFPAANYANGKLIVSNFFGADSSHSIAIKTRNIIPVVEHSSPTDDNHPSIQSAIDGLNSWYGTKSFNNGDLPGKKIIEVHAGIYTGGLALDSLLKPTQENPLLIMSTAGELVTIDAKDADYGFNLSSVNNVHLKGFSIKNAHLYDVYLQGNNCEISFNKLYNAGNSGIKIENGGTNKIHNNLVYSCAFGIDIKESDNNIIKNNTLADNGVKTYGSRICLIEEDFNKPYCDWVKYTKSGTGGWLIKDEGLTGNCEEIPDRDFYKGWLTTSKPLNIPLGVSSIYIEFDQRTDFFTAYGSIWKLQKSSSACNSDSVWTDIDSWTTAESHPTSYTHIYDTTTVTPNSKVYIAWYGENANTDGWRIDNIKISYMSPAINSGAGLFVESGKGTIVQNNIFYAKSGNDNFYALKSKSGITVISDYNTYFSKNKNLFDYNGILDNKGPMQTNDITLNPLFVHVGDYHLCSINNSYHNGEWPPYTSLKGVWLSDTCNSPAIDAGNPADNCSNEPASGNRINQGAFGNTFQASYTNKNDELHRNEINIYPNPSNGIFYVKIKNINEDYVLRIQSTTGKIIFDKKIHGQGYQKIILKDVSSGVYFLTVIFNDKTIKYRPIILYK